jgi:hypothetical protein
LFKQQTQSALGVGGHDNKQPQWLQCVHTLIPNVEDKVPNNKERFCLFLNLFLKAPNFQFMIMPEIGCRTRKYFQKFHIKKK